MILAIILLSVQKKMMNKIRSSGGIGRRKEASEILNRITDEMSWLTVAVKRTALSYLCVVQIHACCSNKNKKRR